MESKKKLPRPNLVRGDRVICRRCDKPVEAFMAKATRPLDDTPCGYIYPCGSLLIPGSEYAGVLSGETYIREV